MSLTNIKRGLSGKLRTGMHVKLVIDGETVQDVTLAADKYLMVEAQEYILVQAGKTVSLELDGEVWRSYTVPQGRVMVVKYEYKDEPRFP